MAPWFDYLMGSLSTALGVGTEFFAPGNPAGMVLVGNGIGQFGRYKPAVSGQMNGLTQGDLSTALSSNPSLTGIRPDMVTGASSPTPMSALAMLGLNPVDILSGLASAAG